MVIITIIIGHGHCNNDLFSNCVDDCCHYNNDHLFGSFIVNLILTSYIDLVEKGGEVGSKQEELKEGEREKKVDIELKDKKKKKIGKLGFLA